MPWQHLLQSADPLPSDLPLGHWYQQLLARLGDASPFAQAVLGGRLAGTPGLAFLAGYQAALRALWPSAPRSLGALCVTENRSTRPADLSTRLDDGRLSGTKDFVTAGEAAAWLLVAARIEAPDARPQLAVAVLDRGAPGVALLARPALPLMPDIAHARLQLTAAQGQQLPGDGWDEYVKPFRSLEDLHVLSAMAAWLYGIGRDEPWPSSLSLSLRLLALLAGCAHLAGQPLRSATSHVLLAGLFEQFNGLRPEIDAAFAQGSSARAILWQRDCSILQLARASRDKRLQTAWQTLGLTPA
jgi:hypothetical protein